MMEYNCNEVKWIHEALVEDVEWKDDECWDFLEDDGNERVELFSFEDIEEDASIPMWNNGRK